MRRLHRLVLLAVAAAAAAPAGSRAALPEAEMAETAPPSLATPDAKGSVPAKPGGKNRRRKGIVLRPVNAAPPAKRVESAPPQTKKPVPDRESGGQ